MLENAEEQIKQLSQKEQMEYQENYRIQNDSRVTKIGRYLRQTNLDELPQLWNVLRGELSLIGPRPILKEEIKKYGKQKEKLLSIRPGLTGYWQINRDVCKNYRHRIEMELYYVENRNWSWDCKIFFETIIYCMKKILRLLKI